MMAMSEDRGKDGPMNGKAAVVSELLQWVAGLAFFAAAGGAGALFFDQNGWGGNWTATIILAMLVLIGGGAAWGVKRLKPWAGPISPSTRKSNSLLALAGLIALPGMLGIMSTQSEEALFSNSPVSPVIAIAAIASWLLASLISWRWHVSADEHERQSYEFGGLAGFYLFLVVTPVWWLAARGDLLLAPDAMTLWLAVVTVSTIGWLWRRYR